MSNNVSIRLAISGPALAVSGRHNISTERSIYIALFPPAFIFTIPHSDPVSSTGPGTTPQGTWGTPWAEGGSLGSLEPAPAKETQMGKGTGDTPPLPQGRTPATAFVPRVSGVNGSPPI